MVARLLAPGGIPYGKKDGQCSHPSCEAFVDFHLYDKPPAGWATVVMTRTIEPRKRGAKRGTPIKDATITMLLCPAHTVSFTLRQPELQLAIKPMVRVIIESPYGGDIEKNLRYLRAAMHDCLLRGEAPYASHALYTQPGVLDDNVPAERALGMEAGFLWGVQAQKVVVYSDLGISSGMIEGIKRAEANGQIVEHRKLAGWSTAEQMRHEE